MQKQFQFGILVFFTILLSGVVSAQPTVRVLSVESPQSTQVVIPVQLFDIINMELVQLGLSWEENQLQFDSVAFSPDFPMIPENFSYPNSSELAFNWEIDYMENPQEGDTLFSMYFTLLSDCGLAAIDLSESVYPLRIQRGGQDIQDLVFVAGGVQVGAYERISQDTTVCMGDTFSLFIDAPLATAFQWSASDGILSCTDCPNPEITDLYGEASFTVEITGPDDCQSSASVFVNVRSYLDFGLLLFSNSPVCFGDSIQFDPNILGAQSYNWSGPLGFQSQSTYPRLPANEEGRAGTYDLALVDQYGCEASASFDVIIADTIISVELEYVDGGCEGENSSLSIGAIEGGLAPFTFAIDNEEFGPIPDGPFGVPNDRSFTLVIQSANGCTWTRYFQAYNPLNISIDLLQSPPCEGPDFDGALSAQISGGEAPYSYLWSTAETTQSINGLSTAVYFVTVNDNRGCGVEASYTLVPSPIDSISASQSFITAGQTVQLGVYGKNFMTISWQPEALLEDPNSASPSAPNLLETTTFTASVTDEMGCVGEASIKVQVGTPNLTWSLVDTLVVGQSAMWCDPTQNPLGLQITLNDCDSGSIFEAELNEAANCVEYTAIAAGIDTLCFTTCLNGTNICGGGQVIVIVAPTEDPVWPGDTNDDGVADQYDVLNFGIVGDTLRGPRRPNGDLSWVAQAAFPWSSQTPEGDNHKHIDTDGNGQINLSDTLALHLNWGLTHDGFVPGTPIDERTGVPFSIQVDTLQAGQSYALPLSLGSVDYPAEEVYGLAFSLTYDPSLVLPGSVRFSPDESWLGTEGDDLLVMQKEFSSEGRLAIGLTRLDGVNVSGSGVIGHLFITIEDDILLHKETEWEKSDVDFYIKIEGVKMQSKVQELIPVEVVDPTIEVITGVRQLDLSPFIKVFPNPTTDQVFVQSSLNTTAQLALFDVTGRLLLQDSLVAPTKELSLQALPSGVYWLRIWSDEGLMVQKLVKE